MSSSQSFSRQMALVCICVSTLTSVSRWRDGREVRCNGTARAQPDGPRAWCHLQSLRGNNVEPCRGVSSEEEHFQAYHTYFQFLRRTSHRSGLLSWTARTGARVRLL